MLPMDQPDKNRIGPDQVSIGEGNWWPTLTAGISIQRMSAPTVDWGRNEFPIRSWQHHHMHSIHSILQFSKLKPPLTRTVLSTRAQRQSWEASTMAKICDRTMFSSLGLLWVCLSCLQVCVLWNSMSRMELLQASSRSWLLPPREDGTAM